MATRRTHSYTRRIKQLKAKREEKSLTQEEIEELARILREYGE